MKLLWLAALAAIGWRWWFGRWPWQSRGAVSRPDAEASALLGLRPDARREEILAAHRKLLMRVHPDRGGSNEAVHAADAARDRLLARADLRDRRRR